MATDLGEGKLYLKIDIVSHPAHVEELGVYIHVCVCICIYIYIYMHTHMRCV